MAVEDPRTYEESIESCEKKELELSPKAEWDFIERKNTWRHTVFLLAKDAIRVRRY